MATVLGSFFPSSLCKLLTFNVMPLETIPGKL
jgi:hypothetical protein